MFNIAILGMGVVGGGVYEVIKNNASAISHKLGGNGEPLINVHTCWTCAPLKVMILKRLLPRTLIR